MAGTVTKTELVLGRVDKVAFTWVSATTGAADGETDQLYTGWVRQVVIVPSTATAPTDQYDVQINAGGVDVLFGNGADCPEADTVVVDDGGYVVNEALTLAVTNAGDAKHGSVIVYIQE